VLKLLTQQRCATDGQTDIELDSNNAHAHAHIETESKHIDKDTLTPSTHSE